MGSVHKFWQHLNLYSVTLLIQHSSSVTQSIFVHIYNKFWQHLNLYSVTLLIKYSSSVTQLIFVHIYTCLFNPMSYCSLRHVYHPLIERYVNLDGLIYYWNCIHSPSDWKTISFNSEWYSYSSPRLLKLLGFKALAIDQVLALFHSSYFWLINSNCES
jgi:hypothetical protein